MLSTLAHEEVTVVPSGVENSTTAMLFLAERFQIARIQR